MSADQTSKESIAAQLRATFGAAPQRDYADAAALALTAAGEIERLRAAISDGLRALNSVDTITAVRVLHAALQPETEGQPR